MERLLAEDRWRSDGGVTHDGPWTLRWREPLLAREAVAAYAHCLQIAWPYAAEGSKAEVDVPTSQRFGVFEGLARAALERDGVAALVAVVTFDGVRQWVFYTRDVAACEAHVAALRHDEGGAPRPLEIEVFEDRGWAHLREEILEGMRGEH